MSESPPCRHEYVRIYQRRLKGLERRLVATRAFLPVGFKAGDFAHLGEGSYCFCAKCRARLYPRRTQAEKAAARLALAQAKTAELEGLQEGLPEGLQDDTLQDSEVAQDSALTQIHVEELELEAVDMQDIEAEGVKLSDDDESCNLTDHEV